MYRLASPLTRCSVVSPSVRLVRPRRISFALPCDLHFEGEKSLQAEITELISAKQETLARSSKYLGADYFNRISEAFVDGDERQSRPRDIVERFRAATTNSDVAALHVLYPLLRQEYIAFQHPSYASSHLHAQSLQSLTGEDLREAVRVLIGVAPRLTRTWERGIHNKSTNLTRHKERKLSGKLVQKVINDLTTVFGFEFSESDGRCSLHGVAMQGASAKAAFRHWSDLRAKFAAYSASWRDGMIVLNICKRERDVQIAQQTWDQLADEKIGTEFRDTFLRLLLKAGDVKQVRHIAIKGREDTRILPFDREDTHTIGSLLDGLTRAGDGLWTYAVAIADELHARLLAEGKAASILSWHALLIYTGITKGEPAALDLLQTACKAGFIEPVAQTFNLVLLCCRSELRTIATRGTEEDVLNLFRRIQSACGVFPDRQSYSIGIAALLGKPASPLYKDIGAEERLERATKDKAIRGDKILGAEFNDSVMSDAGISSSIDLGSKSFMYSSGIPKHTPGQIHEAHLLYKSFVARGLQPDSAMIHPLITALTSAYVPSLEKAMEIYQHLRSSSTGTSARGQYTSRSSIDSGIYDVLLNACARTRDIETAKRLIRDLIGDGVIMSPSSLGNLTVLLMQASDCHQMAFGIYEQLRDASIRINRQTNTTGVESISSPFDRRGWLNIISCFTKLRHEHRSLAPVEMTLEMISDMGRFGHSTDSILYTTLLHFYGKQATLFADYADLRAAVLALHSYMEQDETLEPDLALITALMDAYNRVGLAEQALEVWQRLLLKDVIVDSACIAVVLDTCGRSGRLTQARRMWISLLRREEGQKKFCNKGVWDAWLECLARCGRLAEAIETAFGDMKVHLRQRGEAGPDAKTMEMLMRFASARKQRWLGKSDVEYALREHLEKRLRTEEPEIWSQVSSIHIPL